MAQRRQMYMKYTLGIMAFAAVLSVMLYFVLAPRYCDAKCRGDWRSETAMSGVFSM